MAQDLADTDSAPEQSEQENPIAFEADQVEYHTDDETFVASGNVLLRREDQSVRADTVTWNSKTGEITAYGDVRLVDADGNQLFTDQITLSDEFETGAMENMLLALREGGRLAAVSGERLDDGTILLNGRLIPAAKSRTARAARRHRAGKSLRGK